MNNKEYENIIAFHPGFYIEEIIEELEMTQEEFAKRLDVSAKTISKLINAQIPLSDILASKISIMLGISAETLINLQKTYDLKVLEIEKAQKLNAQKEVAKEIDYNYFVQNKILSAAKNIEEKIENLCAYLKVSDLSLLKNPDLLASFRTSVQTVTEKNVINANVWLQTAINFGLNKTVEPFDEKKLKAAIPEIRAMTLMHPKDFLPKLEKIFRECGVAFVLLPSLKNCGVNGVVKWYGDKVVLAINDRNSYADTFWFSLFHEIGHILQQKKKKVIINDKALSQTGEDLEKEADQFARDVLLPQDEYEAFLNCGPNGITYNRICFFAQRMGIHPGIIIGRLQHDGHIHFSRFTEKRVKYQIIM